MSSAVEVKTNDTWISKALSACLPANEAANLEAMRKNAAEALSSARVPSSRVDEAYRFTDVLPIFQSKIVAPVSSASAPDLTAFEFSEASTTRVVLVDGVFRPELSDLNGLPEGVTAGALSALEFSDQLAVQSNERGGVFSQLNSACAPDVFAITIAKGVNVDVPIHLLQLSTTASSPDTVSTSNPRILVTLGAGSTLEVVEEFAGMEDGPCFTNAVLEAALGENSTLKHGLIQNQVLGSFHNKSTFVSQEKQSSYQLTECEFGGKLSRHDLDVAQLGPETDTKMYSFLLAGADQLLDLHSKLRLEHPDGKSDQVHKCIVSSSSGRGVFDGNVKVERLAQRTDAQQLSRNLLLVPKATVNVKPNLQIIADDVKCTHGCAVSDLEEEQLFYLQSRGISPAEARDMLVFSFGQEVVAGLVYSDLRSRVEKIVTQNLERASNQE